MKVRVNNSTENFKAGEEYEVLGLVVDVMKPRLSFEDCIVLDARGCNFPCNQPIPLVDSNTNEKGCYSYIEFENGFLTTGYVRYPKNTPTEAFTLKNTTNKEKDSPTPPTFDELRNLIKGCFEELIEPYYSEYQNSHKLIVDRLKKLETSELRLGIANEDYKSIQEAIDAMNDRMTALDKLVPNCFQSAVFTDFVKTQVVLKKRLESIEERLNDISNTKVEYDVEESEINRIDYQIDQIQTRLLKRLATKASLNELTETIDRVCALEKKVNTVIQVDQVEGKEVMTKEDEVSFYKGEVELMRKRFQRVYNIIGNDYQWLDIKGPSFRTILKRIIDLERKIGNRTERGFDDLVKRLEKQEKQSVDYVYVNENFIQQSESIASCQSRLDELEAINFPEPTKQPGEGEQVKCHLDHSSLRNGFGYRYKYCFECGEKL
jgi:hypothetical protein